MMDWQGKRVVILGAARQGLALARYLVGRGARVVLNDQKPAPELRAAQESLADLPEESLEWVLGGHPIDLLDGTDLVCLSGGVPNTLPLVLEAKLRGIPLSNDSQIFLETAPCRAIGITGSAGKTTTTALVGRIAEVALGEQNVWVGGNIGRPLISVIDKMHSDDLAVMELSSFQLEIMTRSTQVAAILNITPNHLDRHASFADYKAAKARILEYQDTDDGFPTAVIGRDDHEAWGLVNKVRGQLYSFGMEKPASAHAMTFLQGETLYLYDGKSEIPIMPRSLISLRGEHNLQNVLAACAISAAADLPVWAMREGVEGFSGISHRLEFVRSWKGAHWYNDSIATAPERVIAAIRSFEEPLVLLAGGRDKNLPWEALAGLIHDRVDHLVVFGEARYKISKAIGWDEQIKGCSTDRPYTISFCDKLQEAVYEAARVAEEGDVVLFSPGGTSFDEFRDFEDRGEAYRQWVMNLR